MTHECVVCPVRGRRPVHYERPHACRPCRIWLAETIADIAALYPKLHAMLAPGRGTGQRVTGSRDMPLPLNVDILDLTGRLREFRPSRDALRWRDDQVGEPAVAYILALWVRDWLSYDWCKSTVTPDRTVKALAAWLVARCDDACDHHPAIDDVADEMRELHATMRGYVPRMVEKGEPPPRRRAEPRTAPCRGCDLISLWWFPSDERVRCDNCDVVMTESEYATWARQIIAYERGAGV